jgi:hypothetical protein
MVAATVVFEGSKDHVAKQKVGRSVVLMLPETSGETSGEREREREREGERDHNVKFIFECTAYRIPYTVYRIP